MGKEEVMDVETVVFVVVMGVLSVVCFWLALTEVLRGLERRHQRMDETSGKKEWRL